jgi:hypothetical protein
MQAADAAASGGGGAAPHAAAAAPPAAADADAAPASAAVLGADELRCVFGRLLTLPDTDKDLGRCARRAALSAPRAPDEAHVVSQAAAAAGADAAPGRRAQLRHGVQGVGAYRQQHAQARTRTRTSACAPSDRALCSRALACRTRALTRRGTARSLWFKLFRALDPEEADAAAAAAPAAAPRAPGAPPADTMPDFDYRRRFVEQYCAPSCAQPAARHAVLTQAALLLSLPGWRKTRNCSRCFKPTSNAAIAPWKVRLCSPCITGSVMNKSAQRCTPAAAGAATCSGDMRALRLTRTPARSAPQPPRVTRSC